MGPFVAIAKAALTIVRVVVWPIVYPMLKKHWENYFKDHQFAAGVDNAVAKGFQAKTVKEKLDASTALFKALHR